METFDMDENWSMNQIFAVKCKGRRIYLKTILGKIKMRGKLGRNSIKYKIYHGIKPVWYNLPHKIVS